MSPFLKLLILGPKQTQNFQLKRFSMGKYDTLNFYRLPKLDLDNCFCVVNITDKPEFTDH